MKFVKTTSSEVVVGYLSGVLRRKLAAGDSVLWLVPGGSAIAVAAQVAKELQGLNLQKLTVTLTDERYGELGHHDSNWQQLHAADFHLPGATMVPVLHGHDPQDTTKEFANHLQEYCQAADYCLGFLGMGADGHTAGILPHSPAVTEQSWAASYEGPDFLRVTATPVALSALDEAVVYAMGESKLDALTKLQQTIPLEEEPAQILKKVPTVTVFNDQIGDPA